MAPKECPKCAKEPILGDIWSQTDQLYMEFESEVQEYTLYTVYWCKRCDYYEQKTWDPEIIHDKFRLFRCNHGCGARLCATCNPMEEEE